jgi:hypothetical protein
MEVRLMPKHLGKSKSYKGSVKINKGKKKGKK